MNKKGLSLVELLVGLIIGTIIILTIGVISGISQSSYKRVLDEGILYNNITYGFKMIQNRVRVSSSISVSSVPVGGGWIGTNYLVINNTQAFGICQANNTALKNFVYMSVKNNNCTNPEIIFSLQATDDVTFSLSSNNESVIVQLAGKKNKKTRNEISFDMSSTVWRRTK